MSEIKRKVALLNCPFCGYQSKRSKPWLATAAQKEAGYGPLSYGVECGADLRCGAKVEGFPSQKEANKAWNTRVGDSP